MGRFGLGTILGAVLLMGSAGTASAQSFAGNWGCQVARMDKTTYNVTIRVAGNTGQFGQQPPSPLSVAGSEASFDTSMQNGSQAKVTMTLTGNSLSVQLRGAGQSGQSLRAGQRGHLERQAFVHTGTCARR